MKTALKAFLLCAVCAGSARANWVADSTLVGASGYTSMGYVGFAMDGDGTRGIAYKRADYNSSPMMFGVCYASNDGSGWVYDWANGSETGYALGGLYTRLAYNNDREPVIVHTNMMNKVKYALKNGSSWETGSVTDAAVNQGSMALACDNAGLPHVAMITTNLDHGPHYASYDGSAWSIDTLPAALQVYFEIDLAFDASGDPHILCGQGVYYTNPGGSGWVVDTIPGVAVRSPKIRFDGQGRIRIGCYDDGSTPDMYEITKSGDTWNAAEVTRNAWKCAYAISSGGVYHFGYKTHTGEDTVRYGSTAGGSWSSVMLEPDGDSWTPAGMMVDGDGNIYFAGIHLGSNPQIVCYTNESAAIHDHHQGTGGTVEGLRITGANPFSVNTSIAYTVKSAGLFDVSVYDMAGNLVRVLAGGEGVYGTHEVRWNGTDADNAPAAEGTYLIRVTADGTARTVPVQLAR